MLPLAALPTNTADTPEAKALREAQALQRRWVQQLDLAEKDRKDFLDDGKRIVERYRNETKVGGKARKRGMPILYANTEQLHSALYQKPAKPDVRRRFSDRDPVGQAAAEMIERALAYYDDTGGSDSAIRAAVKDVLLAGRGAVRIEYEPIIGERQDVDPVTGEPLFNVDEDGEPTNEPATVQFLADQKIHHHYVFWQDLLISPARRWADVSWIAFRHVMSADAIEDEIYGNAGPESKVYGDPTKPPLDWMPDGSDKTKNDDTLKKGEVWEIWDKPSGQRLYVIKTAMMPCRVDPDPYELDGFFPMPEPLVACWTTDTITPQSLYKAYEDQAEDLDELARRISVLTKALKRRGIYDKSIPELKRLANANDNEFIAAENYKALQTGGGLAAAMQSEDISVIAGVLVQLRLEQQAQIQAIYEISGISDIMRGSTDPNETLGAQQLKAQTGSMRVRLSQQSVQKFIRDLYRIEVDILCRHADPQTLQQITNMQVTPEIMQVLQSDMARSYRVDVETDSTVFEDATQAQQARANVIQGISQFMTAWAPIIGQRPQLLPLAFSLLRFAVAPAKDSREVQDALDKAEQDLTQAAQAPQQQPQPDPAALANAQAAQAKAQAAQAKAQSDVAKNQTAVQVAQIQAQGVATKAQAEVQRTALQVQSDREQHAQNMAHAEALHQQTVGQTAQQHALDVQRQLLQQAAQQAQAPTGPVDQGGGGL